MIVRLGYVFIIGVKCDHGYAVSLYVYMYDIELRYVWEYEYRYIVCVSVCRGKGFDCAYW